MNILKIINSSCICLLLCLAPIFLFQSSNTSSAVMVVNKLNVETKTIMDENKNLEIEISKLVLNFNSKNNIKNFTRTKNIIYLPGNNNHSLTVR